MIVVQVVAMRANVRKMKVYRVCDDDKVDITVLAGKALGLRVRNGIMHCGLAILSVEMIEDLVAKTL
jgi:hypothetical protein